MVYFCSHSVKYKSCNIMGLIGSIVGGVAGIAGGIAAGNVLSGGYREQQELFNKRIADVKQHRDKVYYQDPTQSAENQAAVTQAQQVLAEQSKRAAASKAMTGGTDESEALQKGQGAAAVGQMMQQAAVQGAAKKEAVWSDADQQIDSFTKYLADSKLQQAQGKAQAISQATSGLSGALGSLPI